MTQVRQAVTQYLWTMTKNTHLIREEIWLQNTTYRLQVHFYHAVIVVDYKYGKGS